MTEIELSDGKYRVVDELFDGGGFYALRYGEEWRSLAGDKLVYAMFCEIEYLREGLTSISERPHEFDNPDQLAEVAKYYLEGRTD